MAALACDGAYLYLWNGARGVLEKIGTGRQGTITGKVYLQNTDVLRVVRLLAPGADDGAATADAEGVGMDESDQPEDG